MPNWKSKELSQIKIIIDQYVDFLNTGNSEQFEKLLSNEIILSRGKTAIGIHETVEWFKTLLPKRDSLKFDLLDATATLFNPEEAQIILYFNIKKEPSNETFIESLFLLRDEDKWKINRIFGLSYEPESHIKHF